MQAQDEVTHLHRARACHMLDTTRSENEAADLPRRRRGVNPSAWCHEAMQVARGRWAAQYKEDTMAEHVSDASLAVLACDIRARPPDAPTLIDVLPAVLQVDRSADRITVSFAPEAAELVTAFVEAERRCCTEIRWDLSRDPSLRLSIDAQPAQLDVIETMFTSAD